MCVHERLAFAFEMGARFGVVFAGWEPMYRNIGLVTGWRLAVKLYSFEQGERNEVCVHSSGFGCARGQLS